MKVRFVLEQWKADLQKRLANYLTLHIEGWLKEQPLTHGEVRVIPSTRFPGTSLRCINDARCCGSDFGIEIYKDGDICIFDSHGDNAGTAVFSGYCCLTCLLLDVWHEFDDDGERVGDKIRELKKKSVARSRQVAA